MSYKRHRDTATGEENPNYIPTPKRIKQSHPPKQSQPRRDNNNTAPGKQGLSVNELKSKVRSTKRLLERGHDLPADVRVEKERALQGYERELEDILAKKRRSVMIQKYHFVRFLERKTATKTLKHLLREKAGLEKEKSEQSAKRLAELDEQIQTARIDLNYTIYCPLTEKYISLFPKEDGTKGGEKEENENEEDQMDEIEEDEDRETRQSSKERRIHRAIGSSEKPPLWHAVKQSMNDGTLELLREGKLGIGSSGEKIQMPETAAQSTPAPERKKAARRTEKASSTPEAGNRKTSSRKESRAVRMVASEEEEADGTAFFEI